MTKAEKDWIPMIERKKKEAEENAENANEDGTDDNPEQVSESKTGEQASGTGEIITQDNTETEEKITAAEEEGNDGVEAEEEQKPRPRLQRFWVTHKHTNYSNLS